MSSGELALAWASCWHIARALSNCADGPVAQLASAPVIRSKMVRKVTPCPVPTGEMRLWRRIVNETEKITH
jgi:hypothetical protein